MHDGHPVVHAGLGSHAGAFLAGEYLTAVLGTRLAGVARAGRRISRLGTVVAGLLASWRATVAIVCVVAAAAFLVINLRELLKS